MKARTALLLAVFVAGLLGLPRAASAQEIGLVGTVVRVDAGQATIWVQEYGAAGVTRTWVVRMPSLGQTGPGVALRVGDVVEIRGVVIGTNQLLARAVVVRSQAVGPGPGAGSGPIAGPTPGSGGGPSPVPGITPRGQRIEIDGVIIAMHVPGQSLLRIQDRTRSRAGVVWTVRITGRTHIEGQRGDRRWGDDDGIGIQAAQRLLSVGDLVEVEGRLVGDSQILAEEIKVRGQARYVPGVGPIPYPPALYPPYGWQTVIFAPRAGEEISGREFTVVGRTLPGAQVQVHVMARWSVFQVQVANRTVNADQDGIFVVQVRPTTRIPGASYTITVTPRYQGVDMTPVSVTVRQL